MKKIIDINYDYNKHKSKDNQSNTEADLNKIEGPKYRLFNTTIFELRRSLKKIQAYILFKKYYQFFFILDFIFFCLINNTIFLNNNFTD